MSDTETQTRTGPKIVRKRPPEFEAWQVTAEEVEAIALWCGGSLLPDPRGDSYTLLLPSGVAVYKGSWVVLTPDGPAMVRHMSFASIYEDSPR